MIQTRRNPVADSIDAVAAVLAGYAERGIFLGFSRGPVAAGKASFQIAWHRGRIFELTFDARAGALRLPALLCDVPADSTMYAELKAFIRERQSDDLPRSSPDRRREGANPHVSSRGKHPTRAEGKGW